MFKPRYFSGFKRGPIITYFFKQLCISWPKYDY